MYLVQSRPCTARLPPRSGGLWAHKTSHFHRKSRSCLAVTASLASTSQEATAELLRAVEGTERGVNTSAEALQRINSVIQRLEALPSSGSMSATWKLLWTTEKETLFILKNAGWFRTSAGEVYQIIDTEEKFLQNVITFPPKGAFIVDSSIELAGEQRVNFQFTDAELQLPDRIIKVPPFGKGWFENVYMDDYLRVSKDIRGDTLVTVRDGPAQRFTGMQ